MPVFGTGHARFNFEQALTIIVETLRDSPTTVAEAVIVVSDIERAEIARKVIAAAIPGFDPAIEHAQTDEDQPRSIWSEES